MHLPPCLSSRRAGLMINLTRSSEGSLRLQQNIQKCTCHTKSFFQNIQNQLVQITKAFTSLLSSVVLLASLATIMRRVFVVVFFSRNKGMN